MALFDAEKIFRNLVAAMGVTPEQITSLIVEVVTEVRTIRAEREAFKAASAKVVPDVLARLERIENKVAMLCETHGDPVISVVVMEDEQNVGPEPPFGRVNGLDGR